MVRRKITLVQRIGCVIGFIVSCFFALSFISTLIVSLLNPTLTSEFVKLHFIFSKFGVVGGFLIHIIGNLLFAAVAIFLALLSWKGFTSQLNQAVLVTTKCICKNCGKVHKLYYKSGPNPTDEYCKERGFIPFPVDDKFKCDCGFEIDLSSFRNDLDEGILY